METGSTGYRMQGDGRDFDVLVEWRVRKGGAPELVGYSIRSTDGRPIPQAFRRGMERLLDGELVSAAYAMNRANRVIEEELGSGTMKIATPDGATAEGRVRDFRTSTRYADPDAAARGIFDESERRRRRRDVTPELLEKVAKIYGDADPSRPTATVAERLHVSSAQASRYVRAAREARLLPQREA